MAVWRRSGGVGTAVLQMCHTTTLASSFDFQFFQAHSKIENITSGILPAEKQYVSVCVESFQGELPLECNLEGRHRFKHHVACQSNLRCADSVEGYATESSRGKCRY